MGRRVVAAACAAALAATLTGCAQTVLLEPGPFAPDPICGDILLQLRGDKFGFQEMKTNAQATMAWGDGSNAIVVRCGVEPPPPTTDRCIGVTSSDGTQIDWINPEAGSDLVPRHADRDVGSWTFITYGREPAVELVVPSALQLEPADVLQGVALAVQRAPAYTQCVGATDVE
ncbi:MAG TPA: DUF3515 family protein [Actinomycetales bacterium]|nr:DUF3515 family protein [Actinomycetales bacterium]